MQLKKCTPIEQLLGFLRVIGRGWIFDDVAEHTAIYEETIVQFYHVYIEYGSSTLYKKHVISLQNDDQFDNNEMFLCRGWI